MIQTQFWQISDGAPATAMSEALERFEPSQF
jgi:hypothetical protein